MGSVSWAQRSSSTDDEKNIIYLTVFAPDVPNKDLKVELKPTSLTVTGKSTTKNTTYHVELELYDEINPAESKTQHTARDVVFVLRKKESKDEYWPRLTKNKARLHFLKTDFDRWVDEDEQEGAVDEDLSGMQGMQGMEGMGGDGGFGGIGKYHQSTIESQADGSCRFLQTRWRSWRHAGSQRIARQHGRSGRR